MSKIGLSDIIGCIQKNGIAKATLALCNNTHRIMLNKNDESIKFCKFCMSWFVNIVVDDADEQRSKNKQSS